jgi:ribose transport system permease protein
MSLLERFGLLGLLIIVVVAFSIALPDTFATAANFRAIVSAQAVTSVVAMGLLLPLVSGRFDVSIGAITGMTAIAAAAAMSRHGLPLLVAILVAVLIGLAVGLFNGLIVTRFGVNSIIGTLGTSTVIAGIITAYTQGTPITSNLAPELTGLARTGVLGVPTLFVIAMVICLAVWYLLTQTPYGRRLFAVGSNLSASRLSGVRARLVVAVSFALAGVLAALAGVLQIGTQGAADPQIAGIRFILPAMAAVFLGATTIHPGRYNVPGTILALLFLGTTVSGLALAGAAPWVTDVFNGSAIIIAIAISAQFRRRRTGELEIGS